MPKTDEEPLGAAFDHQLRSALDRVQPRFSAPRYASAGRLPAWRLAPVALAIAITGILALSVSAATGTVNPSVVMNRISTAIQPVPEPTAMPGPTPTETPKAVAPIHQTTEPEPKESPEPRESPGPTPSSPEPGDDRSESSPSPIDR